MDVIVSQLKVLTNNSNLRIEIAGVIDREMNLIHEPSSNMNTDLNEFKEDHMEQIVNMLVEYTQHEINNFLKQKGRPFQPRVSLSAEEQHEDGDEHGDTDDDSETGSKVQVKRE